MTNTKAIRVKGWRTEITADGITFERGDWFCIARFSDVIGTSFGGMYDIGAMGIVSNFIAGGAPIKKRSATYYAMIEAIAEAVKMNS